MNQREKEKQLFSFANIAKMHTQIKKLFYIGRFVTTGSPGS